MAIYGTGNIDEFGLTGANNPGDLYTKAPFNNDENILIQRYVRSVIFDAMPQQFKDLALFNMQTPKSVPSDSIEYQEMGYQREPITTTGSASSVAHPTEQTISVSSTDAISIDVLIVYPNDDKGMVRDVNTTTNTITVQPLTGQTIPAVTSGDRLSVMSRVQADGADGFSSYFRSTTIQREAFIQFITFAQRFGLAELLKYMNTGSVDGYVEMNQRKMLEQYRVDLSNILWNGEQGEVTTKAGDKAKTMGGIFPLMKAAGSPNTALTTSTLVDGIVDLAQASQFGTYGSTRFLFGTPEVLLALWRQIKEDKTRFTPANDMILSWELDMWKLGDTNIVFVPMGRFKDGASFPSSWAGRLFLLDMDNIQTLQFQGWEQFMGDTLNIKDGVPKFYHEFFVSTSMGLQFNNPLACAYADVSL